MSTSEPKLKFAEPHDPILTRVSKNVPVREITEPTVQKLIEDMLDMALQEQGDSSLPTMVGLAAPQLGVSKRIIIVDVTADGKGDEPNLRAFINPKITKSSKKLIEDREGCYSTSRVCGIVSRSESISIKAYKPTGQQIEAEYTGFVARVFQHEIDHLDGIRFPQRIKDDSKLHWVVQERFGDYRDNWATWDELCPRQRWLEIIDSKGVFDS